MHGPRIFIWLVIFGIAGLYGLAGIAPAQHTAPYRAATRQPPSTQSVRRLPRPVAANAGQTGAAARRLSAITTRGGETTPGIHRFPPVAASSDLWWEPAVLGRMRAASQPVPVTLESLIVRALNHSSQIKVFSELPLIRQTAIVEAEAEFDWSAFMEAKWDDISDPVGNVLTVGGNATRFYDHYWNYDVGLRQRNTWGGRTEVAQRFGFQNNNSNYFQPQDQGTARLTLSYTQPLLRGRGKVYNTSLTVLAQIDTDIARDEFLRQLQAHLLEVTRAYWGLYLERGLLVIKQRLYGRARNILDDLEGRRGVDAVESQIVRVRASVSERESDLLRAEMAVQNAEDRIHALVNDPGMQCMEQLELIPADQPMGAEIPVDMRQSLATALHGRPEIGQAIKQVKAAAVRLDMSKHELLPRLDFVMEAYVSGLRGESDIGRAFEDQFSVGEPSYSLGLQYEVPLHRRASRARHERRQLELRQLQQQFRTTVETLSLEVKVAVREVETSYRETLAKQRSMEAAAQRLDYIQERWKHFPGEDRSVNLYLDEVLTAQERLAEVEAGYLQAQSTYNLALMNLKRATGTLLRDEGIVIGTTGGDCLPSTVLDKQPTASSVDRAPWPRGGY
jgi:outer membrane protein